MLVVFGVADYGILHYFTFKKPPQSIITNVTAPATVSPIDSCGPTCQQYVDDKISQSLANLPTPKPNEIIAPVIKKSKIRTVSYLPLSTGGQTMNRDWTNLSGTDLYLDTHDYPGLIEIYFEANIHLFNGNGQAFVRLFDDTHGVGVQGSEISTAFQKDTAVVSGKLSFYQGKNLIKVQAKSLTADTAIFTSGRLKIITEN